jgi:formylglycine-generating enzyme required for sulfatase activity
MAELVPCPNPSCTYWNPAGRTKCFKCGTPLDLARVESEDPGAHSGRRALIIIVVALLLGGSIVLGLRFKEIHSDKKAPIVLMVDPAAGRTDVRSNKDKVTIKGTINDEHPGVVLVDGKEATTDGNRFTAILDVGETARDVEIVATDKAGNRSAPVKLNVLRDATPPEIVDLLPLDQGFAIKSPTKVSGEANEELSSVTIGTNIGTVAGKTFSGDASLVGGANEIVVKVKDLAGNEASQTIHVRYEARQLPEGITLGDDGSFTSSKDDARLLMVPGGKFTMGNASGDPDERPAHEVEISPFLIDETLVTNAQFAKYASETGASMPPPPDWDARYATSAPDSPVVNVTFEEAQAYAKWAGRRLPYEAEWEKAARGTDGRLYPWGNNPPAAGGTPMANVNGAQDGFANTSPVRSYPDGASAAGALDMAGNVWEWTYDWYSAGYYATVAPGAKDPQGPESGQEVVLRGGAFTSNPTDVRSTNRYPRKPDERMRNVGFRCAVDL